MPDDPPAPHRPLPRWGETRVTRGPSLPRLEAVDQRQLLEADLRRRRNDPGFVDRVKARIAADMAILERLAQYDAEHR